MARIRRALRAVRIQAAGRTPGAQVGHSRAVRSQVARSQVARSQVARSQAPHLAIGRSQVGRNRAPHLAVVHNRVGGLVAGRIRAERLAVDRSPVRHNEAEPEATQAPRPARPELLAPVSHTGWRAAVPAVRPAGVVSSPRHQARCPIPVRSTRSSIPRAIGDDQRDCDDQRKAIWRPHARAPRREPGGCRLRLMQLPMAEITATRPPRTRTGPMHFPRHAGACVLSCGSRRSRTPPAGRLRRTRDRRASSRHRRKPPATSTSPPWLPRWLPPGRCGSAACRYQPGSACR
jgi:hypothetical protein